MSDRPGGSGGGGGGPGHHHYQPHNLTLTQADQDIIKSFLSSVPTGFPLSPGAAIAELSSFSPLSPSLPASNYHFSLSPARIQDPPSPRHVDTQRYKAVQSPKRHHTAQRSSLAGFQSPKRASSHQSPQRHPLSRTHSPDLSRPRSPPLEFTQLRKETFASPAWSPQRQSDSPTYQLQQVSRPRPAASYTTYLSPHHLSSPSHQPHLFDDHLSHSDHPDSFRRPRHSNSPTTHSPPPR